MTAFLLVAILPVSVRLIDKLVNRKFSVNRLTHRHRIDKYLDTLLANQPKDVREPALSYYAGSHRTGHRLAMGSKMAVCLRLFDNGADSIPSNIAPRRLH